MKTEGKKKKVNLFWKFFAFIDMIYEEAPCHHFHKKDFYQLIKYNKTKKEFYSLENDIIIVIASLLKKSLIQICLLN